jgi:hypothetical protein
MKELIPYCHIKTVQEMAGFISELQTTQMEMYGLLKIHLKIV